jgi:hypothetical protein
MAPRSFLPWTLAALGLAASACGSLRIVPVSSTDLNCRFDTDCTIDVSDFVDTFEVPFGSGEARLQSRSQPPGEPGTPGHGLYAHEYRVNLTPVAGLTALICVQSLAFDFGPVQRLDYDFDGTLDDVYVVTQGGIGSVGPSAASRGGDRITFSFEPPVCPGSSPGRGESSYFFGLASTDPAGPIVAAVGFSNGESATVDAHSPGGP